MKIARCCVKPKSVEIYFVRETQPSHVRFELILFGGKKRKIINLYISLLSFVAYIFASKKKSNFFFFTLLFDARLLKCFRSNNVPLPFYRDTLPRQQPFVARTKTLLFLQYSVADASPFILS